MPILLIPFVDAPDGYVEGDPLPPGATPINAAALTALQTAAGAYTDAQVAAALAGLAGSTPAATSTTLGAVRLAGDLGGSAAAPTVPGLVTLGAKVTAGLYVVAHGSDANFPRPAAASGMRVLWIGSANPVNFQTGDLLLGGTA